MRLRSEKGGGAVQRKLDLLLIGRCIPDHGAYFRG